MIFKRLFKPAWQRPEAEKRIEAIASLNSGDEKQRTVLRSLAFNDGEQRVRMSALEKLDCLEFWYLAGKQDRDELMRKRAMNRVVEMVCDAEMSAGARQRFVSECKDSRLIESFWRQLPEAESRRAALARVDKPRCYLDAAEQDEDAELRAWAAQHIDDDKQIRRLIRRGRDQALAARLQAQLDAREAEQRQADEMLERARLTLAQMRALAEKLSEPAAQAQPQLADKAEALISEWQQSQAQLADTEESSELRTKFPELEQQLQAKLAPLQQAWQAQRDAEALVLAQQQCAAELKQALKQAELAIGAAIEAPQGPDDAQLKLMLAPIERRVAQGPLTDTDLHGLTKQLHSLQQTLASLAGFNDKLAHATALVDELEQTELTDEAVKTFYRDWQSRWAEVAQLPFPQTLAARLSKVRASWKAAADAVKQQRQESEQRLGRLLSRVEQAHRNGRYKQVLREFSALKENYASLDPQRQQRFSRRYETLLAAIAELEEWNRTVALPKLVELVDAAELLASTPLADAAAQAEAVKELRQRWRDVALPGTQDSEALALIERFEQASEQAFAPCREHYAELEKQRHANLQQREQICGELDALWQLQQSGELEQAELESRYRKLNHRWQQSGEVPYEHKAALFKRYRSLQQPLKQALEQCYEQNGAIKQKLLAQAQQLDSNDLAAAQEQYKALRRAWRDAGYAGRDERTLWNEFEQLGKALRQAEDKQRKVLRDGWQQNEQAMQAIIEQMAATDLNSLSRHAIGELEQTHRDALAQIGELSNRRKNELKRAAEHQLARFKQARQQHKQRQHQQAIEQLFSVVGELCSAELSEDAASATIARVTLPGWQRKLDSWMQQAPLADLDGQRKVVVKAELLAGCESAAEDEPLRNELQMQRLQQRMQGHKDESIEQLLDALLGVAPPTSALVPLLGRMQQAASARLEQGRQQAKAEA